MTVSQEQYENMKGIIMKAISDGRKIKFSDCANSDHDIDALISLHGQILLRQRKSGYKVSDSKRLSTVIMSHLRGTQTDKTTLLDISNELGIGGYRTAKIAIECLLGRQISVSQIVGNPLLVVNDKNRQDILECIMKDPLCSVECDVLKECSGKEYEALLLQQLLARRMCFETEAELRNRGKPKTPDILLLIPMGVYHCQTDSLTPEGKQKQSQVSAPHVVNWIDSKGMFADEETFEENYEQLKSYVNRYGAGMVIYWHGFVNSLHRLRDEMIFISDRFPDHWIFPTGEPADGRVPMFDRPGPTPGRGDGETTST